VSKKRTYAKRCGMQEMVRFATGMQKPQVVDRRMDDEDAQ